MSNPKAIGLAVTSAGIVIAASLITARYQPNFSPLRNDVVTLINDVGEKVIVLKSTIKAEPKKGKELLRLLADGVKKDLESASQPVLRSDISACIQAETKLAEVDAAKRSADSWRSNTIGSNLAEMYDTEAQEARAAAAENEKECQRQIFARTKERQRLKLDASASKQLIKIAGTPGAYQDYVPTYAYKVLVTDVNGKTSVVPQLITCLNVNAINVLSRERRTQIAPHSFVAFSKPDQMTIVANDIFVSELTRASGSVQPTEDALKYVGQEVCKFKGHVGVEPELTRAS